MMCRRAAGLAFVGLLISGLLLFASGSTQQKSGAATPKSQKKQGSTQKPSQKPFVANPFCMVCHLDFEEDEMARAHETAGIGCERCHGESEAHRSDEANITPPEIMYPKAKINPTCLMCHPRHTIQFVKQHQAFFAGAVTTFSAATREKSYCTDCHASGHRMNRRNVQWDKLTGALLIKDK